jgi:F0F1-type ATP synthase gamma subunit
MLGNKDISVIKKEMEEYQAAMEKMKALGKLSSIRFSRLKSAESEHRYAYSDYTRQLVNLFNSHYDEMIEHYKSGSTKIYKYCSNPIPVRRNCNMRNSALFSSHSHNNTVAVIVCVKSNVLLDKNTRQINKEIDRIKSRHNNPSVKLLMITHDGVENANPWQDDETLQVFSAEEHNNNWVKIVDDWIDRFENKKLDRLYLLVNSFSGTCDYQPQCLLLLPMEFDESHALSKSATKNDIVSNDFGCKLHGSSIWGRLFYNIIYSWFCFIRFKVIKNLHMTIWLQRFLSVFHFKRNHDPSYDAINPGYYKLLNTSMPKVKKKLNSLLKKKVLNQIFNGVYENRLSDYSSQVSYYKLKEDQLKGQILKKRDDYYKAKLRHIDAELDD